MIRKSYVLLLLLLLFFPLREQAQDLDTAAYTRLAEQARRFSMDHQFDSALVLYNRMISAADPSDTLATLATEGKAVVLMDLERYDEALKLLHELENGQVPKSKRIEASILSDISECYMQKGEIDRSEQYYRKSLAHAIRWFGEESTAVAEVYANIGMLHNLLNNSEKALQNLNKALAIYAKSLPEDDDTILRLHNNLGISYYNLKDYDQSLYYFQKNLAVRIKKFGEGHPQLAGTYNNLGFIEMSKGDGQAAFDYYQKGIDCYINTPDTLSSLMALLYINTGQYYMFNDQFDTAIDYYKKGLKVRETLFGPDHYLSLLSNMGIGEGYRVSGKLEEAMKYFHIAASLREDFPKNQITRTALIYIGMGKTYREMGHYDSALQCFQKYLIANIDDFDNPDPASNPPVAANLGESPLTAMTAKARTFFLKYLNESHDPADLELSLDTYAYIAEMIDFMEDELLNEGSVLALMEDARPAYAGYLDAIGAAAEETGDATYVDLSFMIMEKSRAVVLSKSLQESRARKFAGVPEELTEKEREIKSYLDLYNNQLYREQRKDVQDTAAIALYQRLAFSYKLRYDSLVSSIENNFPDYYRLKYVTPGISVSEVSEMLLPEQVLMALSLTDEWIHILLIGREIKKLTSIPADTMLMTKIENFREAVSQNSSTASQFSELSIALYRTLIQPVEKDIAGKDLVIIPDGLLSYLPFELLVKPGGSEITSFRRMPYLMNSHNISYAYSAILLREAMEMTGGNTDFLAFAPDFNSRKSSEDTEIAASDIVRGSLVELEGTEKEIEAIRGFNSGLFFSGTEASESNFKMHVSDYGIIHLATHAIMDDENPLNSRLLFTIDEASGEDGDLYAWELYNMKLNAQMAVLSACNTGFGKMQGGEGVMSLGHAFAYAGCPSIVMSLWPAQDRSTADIMTYYYKGLSEGLYKNEALTAAKVHYLENADDQFTHPFYWAGFIVEGNSSPITNPSSHIWIIIIATLIGAGIFLVLLQWKRRHS